MKFILKAFVFVFLTGFHLGGFAFEISDLSNYQSIVIKQMTMTDSLHVTNNSKNAQFHSTRDFINFFGREKKHFTTQYEYLGETRISASGKLKWYYYDKSASGRPGTSKLNYDKNNVMWAAYAGDTAVIGRKADSDVLLLLIVQKGSQYEKELQDFLKLETKQIKEPKLSWWDKLWHGSDTTTEEYEMDVASLPVPAISERSWMRVYFTPGPDCEQNIISQIETATKHIDVAVYSITNEQIVNALLTAQNRGINIRVITDRTQSKGKKSLVKKLKDSGIPVVMNRRHKIMHNKFAIFDSKYIETGSYNWTKNATENNAENCMFFTEQQHEFSDQFQYLWNFYQN